MFMVIAFTSGLRGKFAPKHGSKIPLERLECCKCIDDKVTAHIQIEVQVQTCGPSSSFNWTGTPIEWKPDRK